MNRPPVNAIAPDMLRAMADTVTALGDDSDVRVIVVRSALPRYFMAGADLTLLAQGGMAGDGDPMTGWAEFVGHFSAVERTPKPVVAAIEGHALGGGCEMALCCDYRIMVDDGHSLIGQSETSLGLIPGAGGTQRLPRLVGYNRALHMILEATRLLAPDAQAMGLVDATATPDGFEAALGELTGRLATMATHSLGLAKRAIQTGYDAGLEAGLIAERTAFFEAIATADAAEGLAAFFGKRPAVFGGR